MGLLIPELVKITAPSYFKIELNEITDKSGNPIDLSSTGVAFIFADNYSNVYKCVYNPFDPEKNVNIEYDSDNGKLSLIFQDYKLRDRIKCDTLSFTEDSAFDSGLWKSYDGFEQIKIMIIWK